MKGELAPGAVQELRAEKLTAKWQRQFNITEQDAARRAMARVYLRPGSGDFKVNGRAFEQYFVTSAQRSSAQAAAGFDRDGELPSTLWSRVNGGGVNGQADAVKLGIARAFMLFNVELRKKLKARRPGQPRLAFQRAQEVRPEGRDVSASSTASDKGLARS